MKKFESDNEAKYARNKILKGTGALLGELVVPAVTSLLVAGVTYIGASWLLENPEVVNYTANSTKETLDSGLALVSGFVGSIVGLRFGAGVHNVLRGSWFGGPMGSSVFEDYLDNMKYTIQELGEDIWIYIDKSTQRDEKS